MRRREFMMLVGSTTVAWPLAARAQQQARPARIGILTNGGSPNSVVFAAFGEKLRERGYVEGRTLRTEFRSADGDISRLNDLAMELVRLPVDVIVTDGGSPPARAAKRATSTIPIVMATAPGDAVSSGLVASLARPGGNITGFMLLSVDLAAKRVGLLREILPAVNTVGVLWSPANSTAQFAATEQAARALGVSLESGEARNSEEIPAALDKLASSAVRALIVLPDSVFWNQRSVIVGNVAAKSLPAIYPERDYADAGGLFAYGPSVLENFRGAAVYVDRILKGSKPEDLPVQQPTKFEFVINLKAAKALGIGIPPMFIARADEVIE